jgi:hypothetical protein
MLHDDIVPKTAKNFRELATGQHGYGYAGSRIFRIISDNVIQGGDVTSNDGHGGRSIFPRNRFEGKRTVSSLLELLTHILTQTKTSLSNTQRLGKSPWRIQGPTATLPSFSSLLGLAHGLTARMLHSVRDLIYLIFA